MSLLVEEFRGYKMIYAYNRPQLALLPTLAYKRVDEYLSASAVNACTRWVSNEHWQREVELHAQS